MATIGDLVVHLDANTQGLESGLDRATKATGRYRDAAGRMREANGRFVSSATLAAEAMGNTARQTSRASSGFGRLARESQRAVPPIGNLTSLLGTLTGYLGARQVIQYADAWNNAANQLRQVTDTAEELAGVQETLMGVANDTRSEFESTANLYSRLARSTTEMGLSQKELIGLTKTINQSFAVSGATAGEAAAAITQLSQGLAAGALRGDEFNSVSEQAPALMRAISESLDMTIGELREFAAEGGITAEIVVNALQESADAIEDDFGKAVATFGQQMTVARNNMLQFIGGSNDLNEALSNLGETAITLSENLDLVIQAGGLLASLIAGRIIGRLAALAGGLTTAAGAATALRTALAFLGGPAGIAVAAAGALFTFREELGLVSNPAEDARKEVELLTGAIEDMNRASVNTSMIAINAQLFDLEKQAREVKEEIESLSGQTSSGALGMGSGVTGAQARAQAELGQIGADRSALMNQMERLESMGRGLDSAAASSESASKGADALTESTNNAASALDKFSASMSPEVEDILERMGPGSYIDEEGMIRDSYGHGSNILQRELDREIKSQIKDFQSERNLEKGLAAAAQRFMDGASTAASKAWSSVTAKPKDSGGIMPTGDQDSVPALAGAAKSASTAMQGSNSGPGKNLGTLKLASEKGGAIDVQANSDQLQSWLANTLSGNAAAS